MGGRGARDGTGSEWRRLEGGAGCSDCKAGSSPGVGLESPLKKRAFFIFNRFFKLENRVAEGSPTEWEEEIMWLLFASASAVFAALTSILAKVGIDGVNSNLATAIRTCVVVLMSWLMVFITNSQGGIGEISRKSWIFLILSGLATGASWLCYYKALQLGEASKVVPVDKMSTVLTLILAFIFLHEQFTWKSAIGCLLITVGTLFMVL